jgi:hypothetical protein
MEFSLISSLISEFACKIGAMLLFMIEKCGQDFAFQDFVKK